MQKVLLKRAGNLVETCPVASVTADSLFSLFRGEFKFARRIRNDYRSYRSTGQRYRLETEYLCKLNTNESTVGVVFPAGLTHRAIKLLERCGIKWEFKDLRPQLLPPPDLSKLQVEYLTNRRDQMKALATIFCSDMGVIDCPTAWGKTFTICQLVRAYPTSNIIVCSYRRDVVSSIYDRLRDHVPFRELGVVSGTKKRPNRVTVSTIDSLEHAQPDKCRLFLYDEVHEAAAESRATKLGRIRNARMFGMSASPRGRTDGADMVVESLFGPVICRVSYQEAEAAGRVATIIADIYRVTGAPIPYENEVEQYRHGIWRNHVRNGIVASVAGEHAANDKQTLIMVDKVEHALFLKRYFLPEWPIVHGSVQAEQIKTFQSLDLLPDTNWLCTPDRRDAYRQRFESGRMRFAIATGVWSQGVDFRHLDVLVRADGRSSPISNTQIPGRLARGEAGLLVDFDDVFDERFYRRSASRTASYKGKGWKIVKK